MYARLHVCVCVFVCLEYIGLTLNINSIIVELMMKSLGLHCIRQAPPKRQHSQRGCRT